MQQISTLFSLLCVNFKLSLDTVFRPLGKQGGRSRKTSACFTPFPTATSPHRHRFLLWTRYAQNSLCQPENWINTIPMYPWMPATSVPPGWGITEHFSRESLVLNSWESKSVHNLQSVQWLQSVPISTILIGSIEKKWSKHFTIT